MVMAAQSRSLGNTSSILGDSWLSASLSFNSSSSPSSNRNVATPASSLNLQSSYLPTSPIAESVCEFRNLARQCSTEAQQRLANVLFKFIGIGASHS